MIRILVLLAMTTPAAADRFAIDGHLIDRCLAVNPDAPTVCVGREADACIQRNGNGPNMVVAVCQENEAAVWDGLLNRTYSVALEHARGRQSEDVGYADGSLTGALRDMQRAWIVYRDASCAHELERWRPFGSAGGPAGSGCAMRQTARQVFELQSIAQAYRTQEYTR